MFLSFLLARMFSQKAYVFFSVVTIALISLFSVGLPYRESGSSHYPHQPLQQTSGIVIRNPLPLSFPFYAFVNHTTQLGPYTGIETSLEVYQIEFLTLRFPQSALRTIVYQNTTYANSQQTLMYFYLDWGDYLLLYFSFFMLVNVIGAFIGYWISRSTLATKLFKGDVAATHQRFDAIVSLSLEKISLRLLVAFYVLLTTVDVVQTILGFPEYEVGVIAKAFIVFLDGWAWLYFPFRIILTFIIVMLIYRYATPQVSKRLFLILSLITLAIVILNTYSLAMGAAYQAKMFCLLRRVPLFL